MVSKQLLSFRGVMFVLILLGGVPPPLHSLSMFVFESTIDDIVLMCSSLSSSTFVLH